MVLLFVALAVPGSALAALSGVGGGTTIANGQATLVSNATSPYSYLSFDDLNGQPVDSLTELSADVAWAVALEEVGRTKAGDKRVHFLFRHAW